MKLHELYKAIIESVGLTVTTDSLVSLKDHNDDSLAPVEVMGKRLVIPTPQLLRKDPETWENLIAFHPLSESVLYGESEVLRRFRDFVTLRVSSVMLAMIASIMEIATKPKLQSKLPPSCLTLLQNLAGVDERTVVAFESILNKVGIKDASTQLIRFYVRKEGGVLNGKTYNRLCRVESPFRKLVEESDSAVLGVKLRQRVVNEKEKLISVLEYLLPMDEDSHYFYSGSNSEVAPNFHALITSYIKVVTHLNAIAKDLGSAIRNTEYFVTDLSWAKHVKDLTPYDGIIEPMEGNIGRNKSSAQNAGSVVAKRPSMPAMELVHDNTSRPTTNTPVSPREVVAAEPYETVAVKEIEVSSTPKKEEGISIKDLNLGMYAGNVHGPAGYVSPPAGPYAYPAPHPTPVPTPQPVAPVATYANSYYNPPPPPKISAKEAYGGTVSVSNTGHPTIDNRYAAHAPTPAPHYQQSPGYPPTAYPAGYPPNAYMAGHPHQVHPAAPHYAGHPPPPNYGHPAGNQLPPVNPHFPVYQDQNGMLYQMIPDQYGRQVMVYVSSGQAPRTARQAAGGYG